MGWGISENGVDCTCAFRLNGLDDHQHQDKCAISVARRRKKKQRPTDRDLLQRAAEALRHSIRMMSCQTQRRLARGHAPCHLCGPAREALSAIEARLKETA